MIINAKLVVLLSLFAFQGFAQQFREVSNEVGIDYQFPGNDYQEVGAGVTVLDVNNDGWDDIFQAGGIFPSKLWLNQKGKFIDASAQYGLDKLSQLQVLGAAASDYDNDGFEDLFLGNMGKILRFGDNRPPVLLHNVKGERFEVVFEETFNEIGDYSGCVWGDVNNDGYSDLFVLNYVLSMGHDEENGDDGNLYNYNPTCLPNKLFLNQEGKGFVDIAPDLGLNDNGCGLAAVFSDIDNDKDQDLILLNDFGEWSHLGNRIFRNEYPKLEFTDISDTLGFYKEFYGMGVGPGDYNNDGFMDYYLTNIGRNYFFVNEGNTFSEKAEELGIAATYAKGGKKTTSWTGIFLDAENDGDLDLFVAKGFLESFEPVIVLDPNSFFLNNGDGSFSDISDVSGINDSLANRGAATLDFDHDGDLDIISGVIKMRRGDFAKLDQKIKLYENESQNRNNWIGIKLEGEGEINTSAVGCSVRFMIGSKVYLKEVDGGSGHSSQSSRMLHFGLGKTKKIENIEIHWTNGETLVIDKLKAGRAYSIDPKGEIRKLY